MIACRLQLDQARFEPPLQIRDADADLHPGTELLGIDRLDHVVVGACVEAGHEVTPAATSCKQDYIYASERRPLTNAAAQLDAVDAGHHPVENRQLRRRPGRSWLPSGRAVRRPR